LRSRRDGSEDWIRFHKVSKKSDALDLKSLGIDVAKPMCVAFTNVFWDAQLHYPANAFSDQREWLLETIRWFANRPDLQLVVRVHPAELSGHPPSRQFAEDEIGKAFADLPRNVAIISPEDETSSYLLAERANAGLIYGTKMGIEIAATGLPVIVAGESWARNKGFTLDATTKADYFHLLSKLPFAGPVADTQRNRALAYARHFFFRRMIPISFVNAVNGPRRFAIAAESLDDLAPGADPGLDVICKGILDGSPFEMTGID
jgi:Capsule polysaccharide biosynthesis protein